MVARSTGAKRTDIQRSTMATRWRDPRLLFGIVLVLGCTIGGGAYASSRDSTVEYWAVNTDVTPGQAVAEGDLVPVRAKLRNSGPYLRTDQPLPASIETLEWAAEASGGELLSTRWLRPKGSVAHLELPVDVPTGAYPSDLSPGQTVDIWVTPAEESSGSTSSARHIWSSVRVVNVADAAESLNGLSTTVVVALDKSEMDADRIGALSSGRALLVRVP